MDQSLPDNKDAENTEPDWSALLEPSPHPSSSDPQPNGSTRLEPLSYPSSSDPQSSGLIDVDAHGNPLPPGPNDWGFVDGVQSPIDSAPPPLSQPIVGNIMGSTTVSEDWEAMGAEALRARASGQPFQSFPRQQKANSAAANNTQDAVKENGGLAAVGVTTKFQDQQAIRTEAIESRVDGERLPLDLEFDDGICGDIDSAHEDPPQDARPETNSVRGDDRNNTTPPSGQAWTDNDSLEDQMTAQSTYLRWLSKGGTNLYAARTMIGQIRSLGSRETIPGFRVLDLPQKTLVRPALVLRPVREITHSTPEQQARHMRLLDHDPLGQTSFPIVSAHDDLLRKYSSKASFPELQLPTNPSIPTDSVPRYASTDEEKTNSHQPASSDQPVRSDYLFRVCVYQSLSGWLLTLTF